MRQRQRTALLLDQQRGEFVGVVLEHCGEVTQQRLAFGKAGFAPALVGECCRGDRTVNHGTVSIRHFGNDAFVGRIEYRQACGRFGQLTVNQHSEHGVFS
ncbi:hypothetical protein FQZ97_1105240 [compost metagenome]